jgi:hypothetical protein
MWSRYSSTPHGGWASRENEEVRRPRSSLHAAHGRAAAPAHARDIEGDRGGRLARRAHHLADDAIHLAELYDQLVVAVDGYSVNGKALEGKEQICREMDTFHKLAAVQQLFATPDTEE